MTPIRQSISIGQTPDPSGKPPHLKNVSGNVAEIISIVNSNQRGANTSANVGLEWMRGLRAKDKSLGEKRQNSTGSEKNKDYDNYKVPRVYHLVHPKRLRKDINNYDYKGNF